MDLTDQRWNAIRPFIPDAVVGDETTADAVCDRIVHNAHKVKLGSESIRKVRRLDEDPDARQIDLPGGATLPVIALPVEVIGLARNGRSRWPEYVPSPVCLLSSSSPRAFSAPSAQRSPRAPVPVWRTLSDALRGQAAEAQLAPR